MKRFYHTTRTTNTPKIDTPRLALLFQSPMFVNMYIHHTILYINDHHSINLYPWAGEFFKIWCILSNKRCDIQCQFNSVFISEILYWSYHSRRFVDCCDIRQMIKTCLPKANNLVNNIVYWWFWWFWSNFWISKICAERM